jgi:hypothetical protein
MKANKLFGWVIHQVQSLILQMLLAQWSLAHILRQPKLDHPDIVVTIWKMSFLSSLPVAPRKRSLLVAIEIPKLGHEAIHAVRQKLTAFCWNAQYEGKTTTNCLFCCELLGGYARTWNALAAWQKEDITQEQQGSCAMEDWPINQTPNAACRLPEKNGVVAGYRCQTITWIW